MKLLTLELILLLLANFWPPEAADLSGHEYNITNHILFMPKLEEFGPKLKEALSKLYGQVEVSVVDCPDLTKKPFGLAGNGLGGRKVIADIGGVPYLMPFPTQPMPMYSLVDLAQKMGFKTAHILGAGQAPILLIRSFGEYMPNILMTTKSLSKTKVVHGSYLSVMENDAEYTMKPYNSDCMNLLATVFISENQRGKVLKVTAKNRTHEDGKNLVEAMRKLLGKLYPDNFVSLGGTFLVKSGSIDIHLVPREFGNKTLDTKAEIEEWLRHFNASAPLICMSTLTNKDPGLELRLDHTHCFSYHGQGSHYNHDTSPEIIEYEGYFTFAEELYRVDRPPADLPRPNWK